MHERRNGIFVQSSRLLQLPVELIRQIYLYCYFPSKAAISDGSNSYEAVDEIYDSYRETRSSEWALELYSACQDPRSHLSLYATCHQLREELFPIFAAHHTFNLSNVFLSPGSISSPWPVYQFHELRYIALRWPTAGNLCPCSIYKVKERLDSHYCIGILTDIENDIEGFIAALKTCPEYTRLESIEFHVLLPCSPTTSSFAQYRALFRGAVILAESLSRIPNGRYQSKRHLLLQIIWPKKGAEPVKVRVDAISKTTWGRIPDGVLTVDHDCITCAMQPEPLESHVHPGEWFDTDEILTAVDGHRVKSLSYPGMYEPKLWKAVFRPGGGWKHWNFAMIELERRRQEAY